MAASSGSGTFGSGGGPASHLESTNDTTTATMTSGSTLMPSVPRNSVVSRTAVIGSCSIPAAIALSSLRGGPTFPGMFIGAAGGIALSHLPGLPMIAGAAIGIGAMTAGMLQLPITAVLLTTLFLGTDGITTMPLVIVAVVVSFVLSKWLAGPPPEPKVPEPEEASVPPQVR